MTGSSWRWRTEHAVWLGVLGAVIAAAPLLVQRLFEQEGGRSGWTVLVGIAGLTLAPLATLPARGRSAPSGSRAWLLVPPLAWLVGSVLAVAILEPGSVYLTVPDLADLPALAGTIVWADTLRRPQLRERDFASRATAAALALLFGPALASAHGGSFGWACFSPVASAELAASPVAEVLPHVAAAHLTLTVGLLGALVRRGRGPSSTPFGALLALALGFVLVDLATAAAAGEALGALHDRPLHGMELGRWSALADLGGGATLGLALAIWLPSLVAVWARRSRALRPSWAALAPALPILLLATSTAFEPRTSVRFPQQIPEAVWNDEPGFSPLTRPGREGEIPFFMTRTEDAFSALVAPRHTVYFEGGRSADARWHAETLPHPPESFWGDWVEILPDARARLSDLPLGSVRLFAAIRLVWRIHAPDGSRASSRWAFAEMATRALRARDFALAEVPEQCSAEREVLLEGARFRPCSLPRDAVHVYGETPEVDVLVANVEDEWTVAEWLDAIEPIEVPIVFAVNRRVRSDDDYVGLDQPTRAPDEVFLRVRSREPLIAWALGLGLGGLVALALLALGRRPPGWLAPIAARLGWERPSCEPTMGSAYRAPHQGVRAAFVAAHELASGLRRVSVDGTEALRRWSFVVILATLIGIALGRLT